MGTKVTISDEEKRILREKITSEVRANHPDYSDDEIEKTASVLFEIETMPVAPYVEYEPAPSLPLEEAVRRINLKLAKVGLGGEDTWPMELVKAETEKQRSEYGEYRLEQLTPDPPEDDDSPKRPDIIRRDVDVESLAHELGVLTPDGVILLDGEGDQAVGESEG
jgi:hypothetical protein